MTADEVLAGQPSWLAEGNEGDVVLSCRIRLARNLAGVPFPAQAKDAELADVLAKGEGTIDGLQKAFGQGFTLLRLEELLPVERMVLVEKHLISPLQAQLPKYRGLIVSADNSISVMVNEEDHFRIQVMRPGLDLGKALELADETDNVFEEQLDFAFDDGYGYLTACPTNIGTALRATAMLHMPGLSLNRQVDSMARAAAQVGLNVRGMYGEGSDVWGDIFQVSNQLAMGYSEAELVESMTDMVRQIASQERLARSSLLQKSKVGLADMIWRAYGVLRYARMLENGEAMGFYSRVLLGIDLGVLPLAKQDLYELVVATRPNHVQRLLEQLGLEQTAEVLRATMVREKLKEVDG